MVAVEEKAEVRVAGHKLPGLEERKKIQTRRKKAYVREEDPLFLPPGWEDDLVEKVFRFDECEGGDYSATMFGYQFFCRDGETVMIPRRIAQEVNRNCKVWKRDKVQKDPKIPSRWLRSATKFKRRCHFESVDM